MELLDLRPAVGKYVGKEDVVTCANVEGLPYKRLTRRNTSRIVTGRSEIIKAGRILAADGSSPHRPGAARGCLAGDHGMAAVGRLPVASPRTDAAGVPAPGKESTHIGAHHVPFWKVKKRIAACLGTVRHGLDPYAYLQRGPAGVNHI